MNAKAPQPAQLSVGINLRFTDGAGLDEISPDTADRVLQSLLIEAEKVAQANLMTARWTTARMGFRRRK